MRKPRGEFLGHQDQRNKSKHTKLGVGDFAGCCNPVNGGGIHYAIESAIETSENILVLVNKGIEKCKVALTSNMRSDIM